MATSNHLRAEEKRARLLALKSKLTNDSKQSMEETYGSLPMIEPDQSNRYQPFALTDLQSAYFAGRYLLPPKERVGCHSYLEFNVCQIRLSDLEAAWNKLIQHHDMLRAVISKNGQQQIQENITPYRFQSYPIKEKSLIESHLQDIRNEMSHKYYAAGDWPLFDIRVTLCDNDAIVHVSMDSWITDGPSASMLFQQWYQLYTNGTAPERTDITFRDYVLALCKIERTVLYQKHLSYWQDKLASLKGGPQLSYCKDATNMNMAERIRLEYHTDEAIWKNIKATAKEMDVTPAALLLTLFANVLRAFSESNEFAIVLTTASRLPLHPDVAKLFGPFTSTSIFCAVHDPGETLKEQVKSVQQQLWEDMDHSLVSAVASLRTARDKTMLPSLPVVFTSLLNNDKKENSSWLDSQSYGNAQTPQVLLDHQLIEKNGSLLVRWDVAHNYFEKGFIKILFERFCETLYNQRDRDDTGGLIPRLQIPEVEYSSTFPAEPFRLTQLQESYFSCKLHTDKKPAIVYKEFEVIKFDSARFDTAINTLIKMHPALRTVFTSKGNQLVSSGSCFFTAAVRDLSNLSESEKLERLNTVRREMSSRFFPLKSWPSFDIVVSRVNTSKAIVHITLDMMVADGFSMFLFYDQLFSLYEGKTVLELQKQLNHYDYIGALDPQKNQVQYELSKSYWSQKIKELPSGPALPVLSTNEVAKMPERITNSYHKWSMLRNKAAEFRVEPVAILLAVYAEIISSLCQETTFSIVFVDYEHRRVIPGGYNLLGDMTNLCWITSQKGDFIEKIIATNRQLLLDRGNGWVSGIEGFRQRVQEGNRPILSFPVAFTNCLDLPEIPIPASEGIGVSNTPSILLDLFVYERDGVLFCNWDYDASKLLADTVSHLSSTFLNVIDRLCENATSWQEGPLLPRTDYAPLSDIRQRLELLASWNSTDCEYNRNTCIHQLFERHAEAAPNNIATVTNESSLSYAELNWRANQLAHFLQKQGVGPDTLVGICLERSHDMIISVLAILKAGAAYVPLNTADPVNRIQSIVDTAKIKIIITRLSIYERISIDGLRFIFVDGDHELIRCENATQSPVSGVSANNIAYVIFTSGSTGVPKGVVVKHRPVINLIEWVQKTFNFTENDRTLFVSPLSFDLSVFDIFGLLGYGGSIRICTEEERTNAKMLTEILCNEPVSFWNSAPSALQLLMPFLKLQKGIVNQSMRLVFLSGDWIPLTLPDEMKKMFPQAEVISLGGATEATVWSNYYPVEQIKPSWKSIPYGRPIQNARYYVLNDEQEPCAVGEAGNLYIGGECLSEGYINSDQLTREKFLPDPFHERSGLKMYKTGDMARFFPDGNIEFLGRVDHQVKIRGFRIELGEIDAALQKTGMDEAVTVMREETTGNRILVAFVVPKIKQTANEEEAKQLLAALLPEYMIPSRVVFLSLMPVTDNGKVDRKVLTTESITAIESKYGKSEEENQNLRAEERTAEAVQFDKLLLKENLNRFVRKEVADILDCSEEQVDLFSNIGHLGFNSLHYTRLSAELMEKLQSDVNPTDFFHHNTIEKISNYLIDKYEQMLWRYFGNCATSFDRGASLAVMEAPVEPMVKKPAAPTQTVTASDARQSSDHDQEIAIIGMWGKMPLADDLNEFWRNLEQERDCVVEIPSDRWDWSPIFGDPQKEDNKTLSNKGGFMREIDKFDAAFFGISPREAELMDPRQRMLLQNVWHSLEDAGYPASLLQGKDVGIFIGATGDEYASLCINNSPRIDNFTLSGISRTILVNRVSYLFNWTGPSEVVDTACSSALVAIHNAVKALHNGDCSIAIAGGINIMIDPMPHLCLSKIGMLSPDNKCKTFDATANGYVRGEGIGTVVLKPFKKAIEDGDHIYAVIKASALNHGGKANALTAPNPKAQSELLIAAYRKANIDPASVSYIEMHGTGTALGDPIEINGLKDAFAQLYKQAGLTVATNRTAIGSVKTNIGHLESAAGIASFLKVVLAMKHKKIPASIHLKELNPHIKLDDSPFYIAKHSADWNPVATEEGELLPRRAGVSSFGFGGVNAHIVLEEFTPPSPQKKAAGTVLVLSAKDEIQLKAQAQSLLAFVEAHENDINLGNMAYTLQTGREAMDERICWVVQSVGQCVDLLRSFIDGNITSGYRGNIKKDRDKIQLLDGDEGSAFTATMLHERRFEKIARLWSWGMQIDWKIIADHSWRRTPLPVYPFKKDRFWPTFLETVVATKPALILPSESPESIDNGIVLTGKELFLEDHVINGEKILPGMAYVAFVYQAYEQRFGQPITSLSDITLFHVLSFKQEKSVLLNVSFEEKHGRLQAVCTSNHENKRITYFTATVDSKDVLSEKTDIDLGWIRSSDKRSSDACYNLLKDKGISYGRTFRLIKKLWTRQREVIASVIGGLSPSNMLEAIPFLDCALQAVVLQQLLAEPNKDLSVPFHIDRLTVHRMPTRACLVRAKAARYSGRLEKTDILVTDETGEVLVSIAGSSARTMPTRGASNAVGQICFYSEQWKKMRIPEISSKVSESRSILVLNNSSLADQLEQLHFSTTRANNKPGPFSFDGVSYQLDFNSFLQVRKFLKALQENGLCDCIVWQMDGHMTGEMNLQDCVNTIYTQFFNLCKNLVKSQIRKPLQVVVVFPSVYPADIAIGALSSFGRSLNKENPKLSFKFFKTDEAILKEHVTLATKIATVSASSATQDCWRSINPKADTLELCEVISTNAPQPAKDAIYLTADDTCLITGGTGKIGWLLGKYLAGEFKCKVVITGRKITIAQAEELADLKAHGMEISYHACDIGNREAVQELIKVIEKQFGGLSAVFHCAGSLQDGLLLNKQKDQVEKVFAGKIHGLINIHDATLAHSLRFFALFSSLTSITGNIGQTDYSYANRFLEEWAVYRNQLTAQKKCNGITIAVSWPPWKEGGMQVPEHALAALKEQTGMEPIETDAAFTLLQQCILTGGGHYIVVSGNGIKIDRLFTPQVSSTETNTMHQLQPALL
ncbi:MAG: amino acid adenylation domain-containing protein [Sediminibacterium magnilacihabitans]|nr:amino acid adenylation domain-containing protein [Sediminibacterium magnilacihabitans]PQV59459.1 amino acid adenylation domain-containing protein [Sediminibacterium magnilacihabitans]